MIGIWSQHSRNFLVILGILIVILFSIPISIAPFRWAQLVGWKIPDERDLALYFGRCLGALAIIISIVMLKAGLTGEGMKFAFELIAMTWASMIVVHIVGAVQRVQPILETLEIGFWVVLALLTAAFWPI